MAGLNNSASSEGKTAPPWGMAPGFQAMRTLLGSFCLTREQSQRISLGSALRRMWLPWDMWLQGDAPAVEAMMDIGSTMGAGATSVPLCWCQQGP